jgi:hypothetical protein
MFFDIKSMFSKFLGGGGKHATEIVQLEPIIASK